MEVDCSLIIAQYKNSPTTQEIQQAFIHGTVEEKIEMMKKLVASVINDETFTHSTMLVVKYVALTDNHDLKKLLWIYWESINKLKPNGSLRDEILLVCNNFRNELLSPNEFVRAKVLKLLSRFPYRELIEPLMQAILENLDNRHAFVRRNALACVFSIFIAFGDDFIGPLQGKLEVIIENDNDLSTRRNAFVLLYHLDEEKAIELIEKMQQSEDASSETEEFLQLSIVELLRKSCITNPEKKAKYLSLLISFINSKNPSVTLECVNAIVALTKSRTTIRLALLGYCRLLSKQTENNVTLFVLGKIADLLHTKFKGTSDDHLADVLTVFMNESLEIRQKGLDVALQLANEHNVCTILNAIINALRKDKGNSELKSMWISAVKRFATAFPNETYQTMTITLLEEYLYLEETENYAAYDVIKFAHKAINLIPSLKQPVIQKCIEIFQDIISTRALTFVLWILGEYCTEDIVNALNVIINGIGNIPLSVANEIDLSKEIENKVRMKTVVLADGTYSTQIIEEQKVITQPKKKTFLRDKLIKGTNYYLKATLAVALSKLTLKLKDNIPLYNRWAVQVLLILCDILNFNKRLQSSMEAFDERIKYCIKKLANPVSHKFVDTSVLIKPIEKKKQEVVNEVMVSSVSSPDTGLRFRQFKDLKGNTDYEIYENESEVTTAKDSNNWKQEVHQLAGYTEPIYAEMLIENQNYNIELIITLVNRTKKTLHNVLVEVSMGGAKSISKPPGFNFPPGETKAVKFIYKIESTSCVPIYGYIVYYGASGNVPRNVPLDHVRYELEDHLVPEVISEEKFKKLWKELNGKKHFIWALKGDTYTALKELKKRLNMEFVREIKPNDFIVANLYAKTRLGEELAVNIIAESKENVEVVFDVRGTTEPAAEWLKNKIIAATNDIAVINE